MRRGTLSSLITIAITGVLAGGCLISSSTTVETTGKPVSPEIRRQITMGETTATWLLATLGEPTSHRWIDDRREILSYESIVTRERDAGVFLLFNADKTVRRTVISHFEFEDGVLSRQWTE